jgi:hypothetical protein
VIEKPRREEANDSTLADDGGQGSVQGRCIGGQWP